MSLIFPYSVRKCLILPAECSPQKSLILLKILPAEFIRGLAVSRFLRAFKHFIEGRNSYSRKKKPIECTCMSQNLTESCHKAVKKISCDSLKKFEIFVQDCKQHASKPSSMALPNVVLPYPLFNFLRCNFGPWCCMLPGVNMFLGLLYTRTTNSTKTRHDGTLGTSSKVSFVLSPAG